MLSLLMAADATSSATAVSAIRGGWHVPGLPPKGATNPFTDADVAAKAAANAAACFHWGAMSYLSREMSA